MLKAIHRKYNIMKIILLTLLFLILIKSSKNLLEKLRDDISKLNCKFTLDDVCNIKFIIM